MTAAQIVFVVVMGVVAFHVVAALFWALIDTKPDSYLEFLAAPALVVAILGAFVAVVSAPLWVVTVYRWLG